MARIGNNWKQLLKEFRYDPLPSEVRAAVIAAWQRGGLLPKTRLFPQQAKRKPMVLFGWLRSKPSKPRELTFEIVADIMEKYGALLERYQTAYVDESWLPVPKSEMRRAFQAVWKMAPQSRNAIEIGWTSLHRFQPNIGRTPVDADPDSPTMLDCFVEISKIAGPEMERDLEEMNAFKRANT
jgi:hypothetical protein